MKYRLTELSNRLCLPAISFLALTAPVLAQQPGPPADRTNPDRERQQDMNRREWQLRNFGIEPKGASEQRKIHALAEQIEQDFSRILILHNKIAGVITANQRLDYNFISDATDEIRKRASRLQSTLALHEVQPRPDGLEKPTTLNHAQLKVTLITLCKQIKSFVTNPVIDTPGTINVEQLGRARHDLEDIIRLSTQIKKDAEQLNKTNH